MNMAYTRKFMLAVVAFSFKDSVAAIKMDASPGGPITPGGMDSNLTRNFNSNSITNSASHHNSSNAVRESAMYNDLSDLDSSVTEFSGVDDGYNSWDEEVGANFVMPQLTRQTGADYIESQHRYLNHKRKNGGAFEAHAAAGSFESMAEASTRGLSPVVRLQSRDDYDIDQQDEQQNGSSSIMPQASLQERTLPQRSWSSRSKRRRLSWPTSA